MYIVILPVTQHSSIFAVNFDICLKFFNFIIILLSNIIIVLSNIIDSRDLFRIKAVRATFQCVEIGYRCDTKLMLFPFAIK